MMIANKTNQQPKKGEVPVNSVPSYAAKYAQNSGPHCYSMAQHGTIGVIMKNLSTGVGDAFHPLFAGVWHMLTQDGMEKRNGVPNVQKLSTPA